MSVWLEQDKGRPSSVHEFIKSHFDRGIHRRKTLALSRRMFAKSFRGTPPVSGAISFRKVTVAARDATDLTQGYAWCPTSYLWWVIPSVCMLVMSRTSNARATLYDLSQSDGARRSSRATPARNWRAASYDGIRERHLMEHLNEYLRAESVHKTDRSFSEHPHFASLLINTTLSRLQDDRYAKQIECIFRA